jgi:transcriptional regulator with XRE-family HTH domain
MGFRENLKEELTYTGMLVKELAAKAGVNKRSVDSYLTENGSIPSADIAVKLAEALGVSVEYLVTGQEVPLGKLTLKPEMRSLLQVTGELDDYDRKILLTLAESLKNKPRKCQVSDMQQCNV